MLHRLHVQNFKCLLDVDMTLAPLTVLIGPNDSGKSSLLDALEIPGQTVSRYVVGTHDDNGVLRYRGGGATISSLAWKREEKRQIRIELAGKTIDGSFAYDLALPPWGGAGTERLRSEIEGMEGWEKRMEWEELQRHGGWGTELFTRSRQGSADNPAARLGRSLRTTGKYRLDPESLRVSSSPVSHARLSRTGDNLAAVLDGILTGPDRTTILALEQTLSAEIPTLSGIALRTTQGQNHLAEKVIEFVLAGDKRSPITIPAIQASDGALLLLAYLALAFSESDEILLIEEPENGLHPSRLKMVIDLLRKISRGEIGNRPRQVILTTHSPILLNYAQPEEVRIVRRNEAGATEVTEMAKMPGIEKLLSEFAIGELWYLVGEDGLLKGNAA